MMRFMPSATVEDYLKHIYMLQPQDGEQRVPMGRLAGAVQVAPGTATAMIKTLADSELVDYEPRGGVRLTHRGQQLALHVLRRHRLVEQFLVQIVGLDWSQVHEEAEELEHAISDRLLERIDALLGHPSVDPHGDPIPTAKGRVDHVRLVNLTECELGRPVRVARVSDQDPRFLQFADRHGLVPGVSLTVSARDDVADAVTLTPQQGSPFTIGMTAAAKVLVEA